jgi:uncharacterized protein YndB with AHSA1/START domain
VALHPADGGPAVSQWRAARPNRPPRPPWCHGQDVDEDGELRLALTRVLAAPRERVFRMLTEPAELAKWWGPHGVTLLAADVDLRADGRYRFVLGPPRGAPFHLSGQFLTVDPAREVSYTFRYDEPTPDDRDTVVRLVLTDRDQGTEVSLTHGTFATRERLDLHRRGWSDSFERLQAAIQG